MATDMQRPQCNPTGSILSEDYANFLIPAHTPEKSEIIPILPNIIAEEAISSTHSLFTTNELDVATSSTQDSAVGKDGICYSMISKAPPIIKLTLLTVINHAWTTGIFPQTWKTTIISPIPKPNKPKDQLSSYRPIALMSCVAKTFERMVKYRLEQYVERNKLIPINFTGFRKGFSTIDSLSQLINDIQIGLTNKLTTIAEMLDIKSAFDRVHIPTLRKKLSALGLPKPFISIINNYLLQRTLYVKIDNSTSSPRTTYKGLPQGSVLSPILFILYTCDIKQYFPLHTKFTFYADDLMAYSTAASIRQCKVNINETNHHLSTWLDQSHFEVSHEKSVYMIFSRTRNLNDQATILFNKTIINRTTSHKLLGLTIDHKLTWEPHFTNVLHTCTNAFNILKIVCHRWWGAHPSTGILLYKALIRSRLEYAGHLTASASTTQWKRLETMQNQCLRLILGAFRSTPIPALLLEAGVPPLKIRCQLLGEKFLLRKLSLTKHPLTEQIKLLHKKTHPATGYWSKKNIPLLASSWADLQHLETTLRQDPTLPLYLHTQQIPSQDFEVIFTPVSRKDRDIGELALQSSLQIINSLPTYSILIYTDGSKSGKNIGSGFYSPQRQVSKGFKLPEHASIFTAEAFAIHIALLHFHDLTQGHLTLLSDSRAV
ncbi:hypothetical protein B566_EDAN018863, partial [Ephemera danica]